jgi:dihydroorotase
MPNTQPALDDPAQIEFVLNQARRADICRVLPFGALTKGREGKELAELRLMHEAGAIGFSDDGVGVGSAAVMNKAFQYVKMFDGLISQHCEEPSLSGGPMNAGLTANRLGLAGLPGAAEELMIARDLLLNRSVGARYHVQHISTAGAVSLVRQAKTEGLPVTTEVTPHHLLLTDEACSEYDTHTKMNPPLRTQADVDACIAGVADGTIEVLATDHAPHAREEKELEFDRAPFGIVGLETAFPLYMEALVRGRHISLPRLVRLMTMNPAGVIRLKDVGTLAPGAWADLTVFDPDEEWTIDPKAFKSKSQNTPFGGWKVHGKIKMTVLRGRMVHQDSPNRKKR